MSLASPGASDLWFLPLGGTGEIGMNLNLYGHDDRWLMVDCGVTFAEHGSKDPHVQMADPAFIEAVRHSLCGLVLTHGHEDHLGAVAHLWPRLRCPVLCTPFAAAVLANKLREAGLQGKVPLTVLPPDSPFSLGPFQLHYLTMTHSLPEAQALVLSTAAGTVFHTGDWKLDGAPGLGMPPPESTLRALGDRGIDALVGDSTNALTPGYSLSEGSLERDLAKLIQGAPGRVVITAFGSNIARLHLIARLAARFDRTPTLLGRSLRTMAQAAATSGYWDPERRYIDSRDAAYLPADACLAVATGSQGDPGAALDRLSRNRHPDLLLETGDRVIFSARAIPGNEPLIEALVERLRRLGVEVISDEDHQIHASGHPAQEELKTLYGWLRPELVVPTHGTPSHMRAHGQLAQRDCGIRALTGLNGDLFMLRPQAGVRRGWAPVGRLGVGPKGLVPIGAEAEDA